MPLKPIAHIKAIIQVPFIVLVIVPTLLQYYSDDQANIRFEKMNENYSLAIGIICLGLGLFFFVRSIHLFVKEGEGTLAPWNPTQKLVISGIYRHVRNPMLIGVNLILFAEAMLLRSSTLLLFTLFFITLNHIYFVFKEEPDTEKRFGDDYRAYKKNVPRWIPRWSAWSPETDSI